MKKYFNVKATVLVAIMLATVAVTFKAGAINVPLAPFTFIGRLMNDEHREVSGTATIRAEKDGATIAQCSTVHRDDSPYNYTLPIQLSGAALKGYAQVDDALVLVVTDTYGQIWAGVVPPEDARVGKAGGVRVLNIVLANHVTRNGVQIDRDLYAWLEDLWRDSACYTRGEAFDVTKDHDGDGIPTYREAFAGTDPFDKEDFLKIKEFTSATNTRHKIVFTTKPGYAYYIESTDDINGTWQEVEFNIGEEDKSAKAINVRVDDYDETKTVYLLPVDGPRRFFRIRGY